MFEGQRPVPATQGAESGPRGLRGGESDGAQHREVAAAARAGGGGKVGGLVEFPTGGTGQAHGQSSR